MQQLFCAIAEGTISCHSKAKDMLCIRLFVTYLCKFMMVYKSQMKILRVVLLPKIDREVDALSAGLICKRACN